MDTALRVICDMNILPEEDAKNLSLACNNNYYDTPVLIRLVRVPTGRHFTPGLWHIIIQSVIRIPQYKLHGIVILPKICHREIVDNDVCIDNSKVRPVEEMKYITASCALLIYTRRDLTFAPGNMEFKNFTLSHYKDVCGLKMYNLRVRDPRNISKIFIMMGDRLLYRTGYSRMENSLVVNLDTITSKYHDIPPMKITEKQVDELSRRMGSEYGRTLQCAWAIGESVSKTRKLHIRKRTLYRCESTGCTYNDDRSCYYTDCSLHGDYVHRCKNIYGDNLSIDNNYD
jgi:hypothetical protein